MQWDTIPLGPGAVLLALVLLLAISVVTRRQSASDASGTDQATAPPAAPDGDPASEPPSPGTTDPVPPRVVDVYVRTLEATLAEQDDRLHAVRRSADQRVAEVRQRQAQRVRSTLLAIREEVVDQPGEVVMNRVEAALARLGSDPKIARPLLPAAPSGSLPVAFAAALERQHGQRPPVQEAEALPAPTYAEPVDPDLADREPIDLEPGGPAPDPADDAGTVVPHRVLPVPAPLQVTVSSRRRRRFGRSRVS